MKKFLINILKFVFLFLLVSMLFFIALENIPYYKNYRDNDYLKGYLNTLEKIKEHSAEKKIIILGGSNVGFGLSAELIEQKTGIKAFNFGVHGGIGLEKPIDEIKPYINENDVLILSPEYENIEDPKGAQFEAIHVEFLRGNYSMALKSFKGIKAYLDFTKKNLLGIISNRNRRLGYSAGWFNSNGDVVGHLMKENKQISTNYNTFDHLKIREFSKVLNENLQGYKYVFIPPVTNENRFNEQQFKSIDSLFRVELKDKYPVSLDKMVFNNDCFYDDQYHLDKICRKKRTMIILNFITENLDL